MKKDKKPKSATAQLYASFPVLIVLSIVMVFATIVYRNNSLGWFASEKTVKGSGMSAEVEDSTFLGLNTHYTVKLSTGEGAEIIRESAIGKRIPKGTPVRLLINNEKINVFTEDGSKNIVKGVKNDNK